MNKYLKLGLFVSVFMLVGLVGMNAFAEPGTSPMILNIGPNGNVLLRGEVLSVSGGVVEVKSWGGSWDVNVHATTKIVSLNNSISDIVAGDFVGVLGVVVPEGSSEIDASIVREWGKKVDHDHDGISDDQDSDDDNDGIPDSSDRKPHDHDNDDLADDLDSDDDNDGIDDSSDSRGRDHDNDGIRDSRDFDDDNDGTSDSSDLKPRDHDNDGSDDDEDEDDDNDGSDDDEDEDDDGDGKDDDEEDEDDHSGRGN